jgi:Gpi18-like mannosyltransferase
MPSFRTALKEALVVFAFSRLTILILTYLCIVLLPQAGGGFLNCTHGIHPNPCLLSWYRWDSQVYVRIAFQGYASTPDVAFYPLWPLLLHLGGLLGGGFFPVSYYLAGLLLSNICFYFALALLYCLLSEEFEPSLAKRALFYLAFYPYALFFFAGYSESLFVLLCIAFFLFLRRGKPLDWWLAGGIGCLAALNRPTAVSPFSRRVRAALPGNRRASSVWLVSTGECACPPCTHSSRTPTLRHVSGVYERESIHYSN